MFACNFVTLMPSHFFQEQEKLLSEGFQKRANQLKEEIQQLKKENDNIKKPSWFSRIAGTLLDAGAFVPGPIGKCALALGMAKRMFF